ncbi:MAG: sigma factor-like helix-turn-helix DNA-binding protein [Ruminococcus sp.]
MLTLKELRNMVEEAKVEERVPSVRGLMESGAPIVVKEVLSEQTEISVYQNGLVLYRAGNRATVFPLHPCGDYIYDSAMTHIENIGADFLIMRTGISGFCWRVRTGLPKIEDVRIGKKTISYSCIAEDWDALAMEDTLLERLIAREGMEEILVLLTENQRYVVTRHYLNDVAQKEIAKELGVTNQAVSDMIRKGICRIRREYGLDGKKAKKDGRK